MKLYIPLFTIIFLYNLCSIPNLHSQNITDVTKIKVKDFVNMQLPPLDSLFENAKNGPIYLMWEAKEAIERKNLSNEKKSVLGFFSLRGSYQYGMFGNEATYTDITVAPYLSYSTHAQNGYTIGAGLNIPLDELFDLKGRVNRQKLVLKTAQLEKEVKFEEVKREIIELYTMINSQINILKIRGEALELAKFQYEISEKDFINGMIESSALSIDKQRQSNALEAFEKSRYELTRSIMILEVVSKTPILKQ